MRRRATRRVSEADDRSMLRLIELVNADFDVVYGRHFALFQVQNDSILVDVLLHVSDHDAVQRRCRTHLQSSTHEPLRVYQTYCFIGV